MDHAAQSSIPDILRRIASDGGAWVEAEIRLAKANARFAVRGVVLAGITAALGLVFAATAIAVLVAASVLALAPIVGGFVNAALVVAAVSIILAAILLLVAVRGFRKAVDGHGLSRRWRKVSARIFSDAL